MAKPLARPMGRTNTWLCQTRSRESSSRLSSQIVTILSPWRWGSRIRARKSIPSCRYFSGKLASLAAAGPIVYIGTREGEYVLLGYNVLFELRVLGRYEIEARLLIEVDGAVREVLAPKPDLGDDDEGRKQYPGASNGAGV